MAKIIQLFKSLILAIFGWIIAFSSLVRLGMGRHGTTSWEFLHLDWIFKPQLSYWGAHMSNLTGLMIGCLLCIWSLKSFYHFIVLFKMKMEEGQNQYMTQEEDRSNSF